MMRLVAGSALLAEVTPPLMNGAPDAQLLAVVAGVLLLVGLWTPIAATAVTVLGFWRAATEPGDPWARILLGTVAAALVLLGPGAWSIDARLFGWKRLDLRNRTDRPTS